MSDQVHSELVVNEQAPMVGRPRPRYTLLGFFLWVVVGLIIGVLLYLPIGFALITTTSWVTALAFKLCLTAGGLAGIVIYIRNA